MRIKNTRILFHVNIVAFLFVIRAFSRFFDNIILEMAFVVSGGIIFVNFLESVLAKINSFQSFQSKKDRAVRKNRSHMEMTIRLIIFTASVFVFLFLLMFFTGLFDRLSPSAVLFCLGFTIISGTFFISTLEQDAMKVPSGEEPTDEKQVVE